MRINKTRLKSALRINNIGWQFLLILLLTTGLCNQSYAADKVILQLPWHHQFQFAGYYAAISQDYYKKAGLDVTLKAGSPGVVPTDEVAEGRADYGVARSELLLHRLHGDPLVALATIFQHSAIIFLARRDSGINNLHDMIGRSVMMLEGDDAAEYIAAFRNEGIALEKVNIISSSYDITGQ